MRKYPTKKLIQETKAIIRLYQFLQHECGLKFADKFSAKELKRLLYALKTKKRLK
jgi:hypothetical protein